VDQVQIERPGPRSLVEERLQLVAAAASELDDPRERVDRRQNVPPVSDQQSRLGPRDRVPGKATDCLEERRTELVVKITRRELARLERQVVANVERELAVPIAACARTIRRDETDHHGGSLRVSRIGTSRRRMGSACGTSCGRSVVAAREPWPATPPSSRRARRRRNRQSTQGRTGWARIPETARRACRSTPSRCPSDRL